MAHPRGESGSDAVRLDFDRRLMLRFRGSLVTSDAGLLAYRELDDVLGLTETAGDVLADARSGKNGRHALAGLFPQSVFGRLAGYEDVNDAERLRHDPAMRWIVGGKAAQRSAASPSQMGRFETQWLAAPKTFAALADLSGQWIDLVHGRRPPRGIVLDMDSSVSPTHGEQEMSVWNGHYACTCYRPLFVFNQFGDLERCALRAGNVHSADGWDDVLKPVVARYQGKVSRIYFRADAAFAMPEVYEFLEAEGDQIRDPATGQPGSAEQDRLSARAPSRTTSAPSAPVPCQFQLSGRNLDQAAEGYRQGRVASRRTLSPRRLHRDERAARPSASLLSTTSAGRASNGSRRAKARSSGRDCRAERSPPMRCGSSFMRSPTTSAISCARWRRRSRSRTGR